MLTVSKKLFIVIAGFMLISSNVFSQEDQIPVKDDQAKKPPGEVNHKLDLGIGFGLDYGGIVGVQLGVTAVKHLTLFAAGGYYNEMKHDPRINILAGPMPIAFSIGFHHEF
jgi:hypothetical protein